MKSGLIAAFVSLVALAACATSGAAGSANATVKVAVKEFSLKPAVNEVSAGKVTFVVRNTGRVDHQLVVLRTKRSAKKLYLATTGDVFEIGRIGKTTPIDAGRTKTLTLALEQGHYSLLCNLPGHYKAGQFADFTVR
jgi:uncharacterized cupredoxin-like copper-binding protein